MNGEIWKDIPGYEGLYQASSEGRIKSLGRTQPECWKDGTHFRIHKFPEKIMKFRYNANGYAQVNLFKQNKDRKNASVHRLVAMSFLENPKNLPCINHKDENPKNNKVSNLEWCTQTYNVNYGNRIKKYRQTRGVKVDRYTLNNVFIDSWESMNNAAENVYGSRLKEADIRYNCLGKIKQVGEYKWKFHNES